MAQLIGITGLIGSGKSTVARLVAAAGHPVIDADQATHQLYAHDTALRQALEAAFGAQVLLPGGVNRAHLASLVFRAPQALALLESLVHPVLRKHLNARIEAWQHAPGTASSPIFLEVPLLSKWPDMVERMAQIWVVESPEEIRVQRLLLRGLQETDARNRIAAQRALPGLDQAKVRQIDNSTSLEAFQRQVQVLLTAL